ncbi:MAG: DUF6524 family protein [Gammaproteobacteria bacterium]|nr:DUF6524 family protein [Gammaproteobacteria bacterium]
MADQRSQTAAKSRRPSSEFTLLSFIWRFLFALFMVLATYNPSGVSVFHWIRGAMQGDGLGAVHFFVGVLLLIGWSILWIATWRALETFGVILASLAIAALVWLLIDLGVLTPDSSSAITWIVLVGLAGLLSIGLSWSHVWRRLTGQFDVDADGA